MLISVIVPVYNVEKYLKKCVDSILKQTYKELEIILVDDESKDNSGKICDEYAKEYENIITIHKKNAGLGMARNTGMENMHGEYVVFIDSDDYIDDSFIEDLYNAVRDNKVDFCKAGFTRVDDMENEILQKVEYNTEVFVGNEAKKSMIPRMIGSAPDKKDSIEMAACAVLYKTKHIIDNKLRFPSERELISEDLIFNIDYLQYSNGACVINNTGYKYRYNMSSLTKKYRKDRFEASTHFYQYLIEKVKKMNYDDAVKLRLSRMYFIYIRMSISQETPKISGKSKNENINKIKEICKNSTVRNAIDTYPIKYLGIKQKMFLKLIKHKMYHILYFLAVLNKV